MNEEMITPDAILAVMRDPKNRKRKLWTASVVLDRISHFGLGPRADPTAAGQQEDATDQGDSLCHHSHLSWPFPFLEGQIARIISLPKR